jgi:hypothetical protein
MKSAKGREYREALIDALVVNHIYRDIHDKDARRAVADLVCHEINLALDPQVSSMAANMINGRDDQFRETMQEMVNEQAYSDMRSEMTTAFNELLHRMGLVQL